MEALKLMTTAEAARVLGVSADRVRQLERAGELSAMRTATGMRIFAVEDVEALRRRREQRRRR